MTLSTHLVTPEQNRKSVPRTPERFGHTILSPRIETEVQLSSEPTRMWCTWASQGPWWEMMERSRRWKNFAESSISGFLALKSTRSRGGTSFTTMAKRWSSSKQDLVRACLCVCVCVFLTRRSADFYGEKLEPERTERLEELWLANFHRWDESTHTHSRGRGDSLRVRWCVWGTRGWVTGEWRRWQKRGAFGFWTRRCWGGFWKGRIILVGNVMLQI